LESDTFGTEITKESPRLRVQQIGAGRVHESKRYTEILSFVHRNYLFASEKGAERHHKQFLAVKELTDISEIVFGRTTIKKTDTVRLIEA
jgi:hypothetical protein